METPQYMGATEDVTKIGNVSGEVPERRIISYGHSDGLPGLILKEYVMEEKGKLAPTGGDMVDIATLLTMELETKNIMPHSGIGFSVLSSEILNVCRWDTQYVDVVIPQIYTLENGLWTRQKVEIMGAFCSGEKRVYDHENEAWLTFLNSDRTDKDKLVYLNDFLTD